MCDHEKNTLHRDGPDEQNHVQNRSNGPDKPDRVQNRNGLDEPNHVQNKKGPRTEQTCFIDNFNKLVNALVMNLILKAINDIKSEVDYIKKHAYIRYQNKQA